MSKDSYGDGNVYRGQRSKDSAVKTITWERSIETFSDEQLLFELVRRNGFQRAAKRTEYYGEGWMTSIVGIGKDHSVSITMDADDFKELAALAVVGFKTEAAHGIKE